MDAGAGVNRLKDLAEQKIDMLIFTHFHPDHGREAYLFRDAQWWAHGGDAPAISSVEAYKEFRGYNIKGQEYLLGEEESRLGVYPHGPVAAQFRDGEWLDFGNIGLQVIHTPGHTAGHCCFFEPKQEVLFSADIDASSFGPWYGDPVSDIEDSIKSINRVIELKPKLLISSHGQPLTENITEKLRNYCSVIFQREEQIIKYLKRGPAKLETLVGEGLIYRKALKLWHLIIHFERVMLKKHLELLERQGEVILCEGLYQLNS